MPDNTGKVALFIDFDNIRIGIRQHFSTPSRNAELHPGKLMTKASKYGRVVSAKAYADFTGHPKEFQDKLLFAAGIEPIHAPSKISGGRRQSSADMHMVIDMFLEAIDHEDIDTFVLMTGDADFVRMVATLRRRFGRRVVISGVQSTSTSLDLQHAGDVTDPITRQDCDLTGELGPMTRPLVTRADLEAQAEAAEMAPEKGLGGLFGGLFRRRKQPQAGPTGRTAAGASTPALAPVTPPAPRRMRASELRSGPGSRGGSGSRAQGAGTAQAEPASRRGAASATRDSGRPSRGRPAAVDVLPPAGPNTEPDDVERSIVREIHLMPPGRMGYTTIKTIEETLRSKAGAMGATRKEIPTRLERLEAMGIFKRESRPRGSGQVETGALVESHPVVAGITSGVEKPQPKQAREPRAPRRGRGDRVLAEVTATAGEEPVVAEAPEATADSAAAPEAETTAPTEAAPAAAEAETGQTFRWVTAPAKDAEAPDGAEAAEEAAAKPVRKARAPRKAAPRKPATRKATTRTAKAKPTTTPEAPEAAEEASPAAATAGDSPPG